MKTANRLSRALLAGFIWTLAVTGQASSQAGFQDALRDVLPAVVHVQSLERPLRPASYPSPHQFFFQAPPPQGASVFALGTGFLIRPLGYCITSFQAVDGAQGLEIVTADKRRYKASLVGGDRSLDLALLKWERKGTTESAALDFAESDRARVGDPVVAIGKGLGFQPFLASGLLAAKGHVLGSGVYDRHFLLDFPTHPGNAGGPVIDMRGRVLGMASYVASMPSQFGFFLPSKLLQASLRDLISYGKLSRPWLGMVGKNLNSVDSIAEVYDPSIRSGVLVENLIVDGPAAKGGLQVGDLILSAGAGGIKEVAELQGALEGKKAGQSLELKVFRRKQGIMVIKLQLGEVPSATDLPSSEGLI